MQVYVTLLAIAVILVASTESKPTWPHQLYFSSYQYPSAAVSGQSQLHHYRDTYSPYYVYNVHTHNPQLPEYNFFYGTPSYDFRFPLSPFYPAPKPSESSPGSKPTPATPTSSDESTEGKDDKVEKLDTKIDSGKEEKNSNDVHTQNPQLPEYNFFYGTPVYDFRFPFSPFYPALKPSESSPGSKPTLTSTSKDESTEGKDDKVEKLDTKIESEKEDKKSNDVHTYNPQLHDYSFFDGTPVYDFRSPLSSFYPAPKPSESSPGSKPTLTSTSKNEPTEGKGDKVEKLDTKVESEKEEKNLSDTEDKNDNDSITVDSI